MELVRSHLAVTSIFSIGFTDNRRLKNKRAKTIAYSNRHGLESKSILIVDDSEDNLEIIKIFLSSYVGEVDIVTNGKDALSKMKSKKYDVVLMDIEMPDMNGFQVIKELRSQKFKTPVIALTAHAMPEDRQKTKKAGFSDHVTKPIDFNHLITVIEKS